MNVFLSWSGTRSKEVASLLRDWLRCVIQAARPWISTRDLDRGSLWFGEINDQLKDTTVGIICLTKENKTRPWILFEAGALAKGLSTSRVCTFLVDLETREIQDPLAQFNHTFPNRESVLGLVKTLNRSLGANGLDDRILEEVFATYWPQFEDRFNSILSNTESPGPTEPRSNDDVLGEILDNTRTMTSRVMRLEGELDRIKMRDSLDLPKSGTFDQIVDMVRSGIPDDAIVERFYRRVPKPIVKQVIEQVRALKEADKEPW